MGARAGVLRQDMGRYDTIDTFTRLRSLDRNIYWLTIIVSRIPTEFAEIEAVDSNDVTIDYDYEVNFDYDEDEEDDIEHWAAAMSDTD